jgi:hypothetical protein
MGTRPVNDSGGDGLRQPNHPKPRLPRKAQLGELIAVDLDELVDGVEYPPTLIDISADREFAELLSPRFKSLQWTAQKRPEVFAPALYMFAVRRRAAAHDRESLLPQNARNTLWLIPGADRLRVKLGSDWDPQIPGNSWPRHVFLAVDEVVLCFWLLRAGMTIPAAVVARTLLERWSLNVGHSRELDRGSDEALPDYISRVWNGYGPDVPGNVGDWWGWLSELLHGRSGDLTFGSESAAALSADTTNNLAHHIAIAEAAELCLRQIRGAVSSLAREDGLDDGVPILQVPAPVLPKLREPFSFMNAYLPLDYYETYRVRSETWIQIAEIYRREVVNESRELHHAFDPVMAQEAMLERRGRAVEMARIAFTSEKAIPGEEFDPGYLAAKIFRSMAIAEMGRQLATQVEREIERVALITAAMAIDGAMQLWLEDSDYSLGCLRVLLEQTARLRAHRRRPARAARLENVPNAGTSRWVSEAGWGRLAVLVRAVNEFSHLGHETRRRGAREALVALQINGGGEETGRGAALTAVIYMFAFELHDRLVAIDEEVAKQFTEGVTLVDRDEHLATVERYLNNAQSTRDLDFGEPDMIRTQRQDAQPPPR